MRCSAFKQLYFLIFFYLSDIIQIDIKYREVLALSASTTLNSVSERIVSDVLSALSDKVYRIILYGSYARGDFDEESDIDIMVLLNCKEDELGQYRTLINRIASRASLDHDIEVSLLIRDRESFENRSRLLGFYRNIQNEGIVLYG